MERAEVVFISTPGIGNLVPVIEFSKLLTHNNPHLSATVLLINIPQRPLVQSYIDSLSTSTGGGRIRCIRLPCADPPSPDQYDATIGFLSLLIENHKPFVKDAISELMSSVRLVGLFIDMFTTTFIDVATEFNIPCYLYFASPATFLSFMLHLPALEAQTTTEFKDLGPEFDIPGFSNPVPLGVFPTFALKRKEDAYFWFLHHAKRYRETKGIVINTFQELEPCCLNSLSGNETVGIYPIGPVLDLEGPARWHPDSWNQEKVIKWLDNQPPSSVLLLSFGSMGSLGKSQLREIATGLERAGCRFLWSVREPPKGKLDLPSDYASHKEILLPDGFLERTDGKGLVCGWVPQASILGHEAIGGFVTHCGWNSILESLWHGVPIATWPIYAEQQLNAFEMVKGLRLAEEIKLDYRDGGDLVMAEEVERGVKKLMDSHSEISNRVKEMSQKCKRALLENGSSLHFLGNLIQQLLAAN